MADILDHDFLRTARPKDVALHLRRLDQNQSQEPVTQQLLDGVESGSLPPMVYALWTSSCPNHSATIAGLQQSHSIIVRSSAIRNFRRRFRTADCEGLWRTLGGTQGIVRLLATFSVVHVKEFCKAIARCSTSKHNTSKRQELVTDLLRTLTSEEQTAEDRSLLSIYAKLMYACTTEFKDAWILQHGTADLNMAKVFENDAPLYQSRCLATITTCDQKLVDDFGKFSPLFNFIPREPDQSDVTVSSSMAFALRALQLMQQLTINLENADWLENTMCSLLRRLVRRKASTDFTSDALDVMAYCALQRPDMEFSGYRWTGRRRCHSDYEKYWSNIMTLWRQDSLLYERKLTPLVRKYKQPLDLYYHKYDNNVETHVFSTRSEHRYSLLRWILANHPQYRIDIDDVDELRRKDIKPFSEKLLLSLPSTDAVRLFDRFESARPGKLKLKTRDMRELDKTSERPLGDLLRLHLVGDPDLAFREGQNFTLSSKQMAEDSGSQPIRSAWINAAMYFAVASRSLSLLQDTVIWARRFSRDPKTVKELYGSSSFGGEVFSDKKTISLLSGIPGRIIQLCTLADVERNIRKGNEVALELLHSAVLAQTEPFFRRRHWEKVFVLYREIVSVRLRKANMIQSRLKLTDDQVYSAMWQPTLDMLLEAEGIGLEQGNEGLKFNETGGPLLLYGRRPTAPKHLSTPTLRFMNELAIRRDSIWIQRRVVANPAVATLDEPWPRGLPIQKLWFLKSKDATRMHGLEAQISFLARTAEDVVFLPADLVLRPKPCDEQTLLAIGDCVDSYPFALRLYLSWCTPAEKHDRLQRAWVHATETLRGDRMTALESRSYWKFTFAEAGTVPTSSMMNLPSHKDPRLPVQGSVAGPIKWRPWPCLKLEDVRRVLLDALIVDCFRAGSMMPEHPSIDVVHFKSFWDLRRYGSSAAHVPADARDAFIAAALLAIASESEAGSVILSRPFPITKPRFPALSLDTDALRDESPTDHALTRILEILLPAIPPGLLVSLASGLVEKSIAKDRPSNTLRKWTSFALRLLVRSDKPELAADLIIRVILETPCETPWHQILLTAGVLKRLPPNCAKKLVEDVTDGIVRKLDNPTHSKPIREVNKITPGPYIAKTSTIKVTTVKLLVSVLKEASFLGDGFIVNALTSLFSKATHVHIRAIVVDSLAAVLFDSQSDGVRESIIHFLEMTVVPVAAELNERLPMTENDWEAAEKAKEPPEVYSDVGFAPVCAALMKAVRSSVKSGSLRTYNLVNRILLPLIRRSRENNTRWLKTFLRKQDASHLAIQIPEFSSNLQLLEVLLLEFTKYMPTAEFANLNRIQLFATHPPEEYQRLAARLERQPEIHKQNDTRHWLRVTGNFQPTRSKGTTNVTAKYPEIVKALQTAQFPSPKDAVAHDLITPAHLQAHERNILDLLAADFPTSLEAWEIHTAICEPPLLPEGKSSQETRQRWRLYCQPLVQHAVFIVETLRTRDDWQRNPQRRPTALPDVFQLQLWLLPYPSLYPVSERGARLSDFAGEVKDIIRRLALRRKPYHARWLLLRQAVRKCVKQDFPALALYIGRLEGRGDTDDVEPGLAECLCVELACELLTGSGDLLGTDLVAAEDMVRTWMGCFDEDVRRFAERSLAWLEGKVGWHSPLDEQQQQQEYNNQRDGGYKCEYDSDD